MELSVTGVVWLNYTKEELPLGKVLEMRTANSVLCTLEYGG